MSGRRWTTGWAIAVGGALFATLVIALGPERLHWLPDCPFRALTGWLCPGCGSTRALSALIRGHPLAAFALNPLSTTFLLALPGLLWLRRRGYRPPPALIWAGLAALLLFWLARNLPIAALQGLRP